MENTLCEKKELVLKTGDMIFLYTDGVTEAMNPQQQQFSEARLKEALTRCRDKDLQAMITAMREEVRVFAQDAQQSDDITMLAVRYKGSA
jgi:sigma-B regulation protein RsbU (phosphoserine phosphatase)